jgi:hypothetical protein
MLTLHIKYTSIKPILIFNYKTRCKYINQFNIELYIYRKTCGNWMKALMFQGWTKHLIIQKRFRLILIRLIYERPKYKPMLLF